MNAGDKLVVHCRWLIRRDLSEVLAIEQASFPHPWTEQDFLRCLREKNCIGMVAEVGDDVWGFMIYELHKPKLHVLNFAVHPDCRRMRGKVLRRDSFGGDIHPVNGGVGACMVAKLVDKLRPYHRTRLTIDVGERNLEAQLFLKNQGFRCTNVCPEFFTTEEGGKEDGYHFCYRLPVNVEKEVWS